MRFRQQVIVATPKAEESKNLAAWLDAAGFEPLPRSTPKGAMETVAGLPFDLLIADAGFVLTGGVRAFGLARVRETPVIVIGDAADAPACAPFGPQAMFVERPLDPAVFACMVTMALMESRPERRSPRRIVQPCEATVNGAQAHIIDVSREGVRLELARDRRMVSPDFVIRVPAIGVGVTVQRRWVRLPPPGDQASLMWCGGQLHNNTVLAQQAWQRFIETLTVVTT